MATAKQLAALKKGREALAKKRKKKAPVKRKTAAKKRPVSRKKNPAPKKRHVIRKKKSGYLLELTGHTSKAWWDGDNWDTAKSRAVFYTSVADAKKGAKAAKRKTPAKYGIAAVPAKK